MAAGKIKAKMSRATEERHVGKEPEPNSVLNNWLEVAAAYNHYNYFYSSGEAADFLKTWMKNTKHPLSKKMANVPDWAVSRTACWIARMLSRNVSLPQETMTWFNTQLTKITVRAEEFTQEKAEAKETAPSRPMIKINPFIADIEDEYDKFCETGYEHTDFNAGSWYRAKGINQSSLKEIVDFYRPQLEEIENKSRDPQIKEAYAGHTKKQIESIKKFLKNVIEEAETILNNQKRARKPRKKIAPKAEKVVAKLKYLQEDKDLGIASFPPEKIVGSSEVWVFDTGSRILTRYVAAKDSKLSVRGTTLLNYSEEESRCRRLRKPDQVIPDVVRATRRELPALFEKLKTQVYRAKSGRVNDRCILLRVF